MATQREFILRKIFKNKEILNEFKAFNYAHCELTDEARYVYKGTEYAFEDLAVMWFKTIFVPSKTKNK